MTTLTRSIANRLNAQLSTGPTSQAGKAVARMNALSHGLRATGAVIPGEDLAVWEAFREAIVADLAPVGVLEEELADRVASLSWRLRRVARYEAGVAARGVDRAGKQAREEGESPVQTSFRHPPETLSSAELKRRISELDEAAEYYAQLSELLAQWAPLANTAPVKGEDALNVLVALGDFLYEPDDNEDEEGSDGDGVGIPNSTVNPFEDKFLAGVGVPSAHRDEPQEWGGWTVGAVRRGAARVGREVGWNGRQMLEVATAGAARAASDRRSQREVLARELAAIEALVEAAEAAARERGMVPVAAVDAVVKYEGHLQRQLTQILHELERRQALRSEFPPLPPAAVDVTLHAPEAITGLLGTGGG